MNKEKLRKADMYEVLEGKIVNKVRSLFSEKRNLVIRRGADEKQVSFIARSLGEMYKDGITINKALTLVRESVSHKEYMNSLKTIHSAIHNGKGLSEAFKECTPLYPELFIGLIFIGENTGKLYEILKRLGNFYEKIYEIKNEVKMACIYPLFIIISIISFIGIFICKIIPSFYGIYNSMGITPSYFYRCVYNFQNNFTESYFVNMTYILCWTVIWFMTIKFMISNGKFDFFLKVGLIKDVLEYITILIFSIITNSGINILHGLELCSNNIKPEFLNSKILEIRNSIMKGKTLSESLEESMLLSNYTLAVIKVREETGSIAEGFEILSIRLEGEIHKKIRNYLKALNPLLIIVMGTIVLIFISVFVLPLFKELQSGIR